MCGGYVNADLDAHRLREPGAFMSATTLNSLSIARSSRKSGGTSELSAEERREYAALSHDSGRADWLAGRHAAKKAVSKHCAVPVKQVYVVGRRGGAPVAMLRTRGWNPLPVSISISHHDGYGLAAVADSPTRVGVDLARLGEIDREHYRYFLTAAELSVVDRIDATVLWALKEAAWKALALSAERTFASLELLFDESDEVRGVRVDGRVIAATARTWRFSRDLIGVAVQVGAEVS
jgi:phosphopantetheinyl transferase (holo-ACP synthase)